VQAHNLFDLAGRVALVTGASSGLGRRFAEVLAANGAAVALVARRHDRLAGLAQEIEKAGGRSLAITADVTNRADMNQAFDAAERAFGIVDILINNAGVVHADRIIDLPETEWRRVLGVNLDAVLFWSQEAARRMLGAEKPGAIVNIASIAGIVGLRDRLAYCTTKFAVVGFTKAVALDHALDGIRVNCICPGRVETPFVQARIREYPDPEQAYRDMAAAQAMGRMGRPEEIAAAAEYLASDDAAFITGSALIIDGGLSAGK